MDFDCDQGYLSPRMLGAQAILFYDNGRVTQGQAMDKFLPVPVDVPRFWVKRTMLRACSIGPKRNLPEVPFMSKMDWEEVVLEYFCNRSRIRRLYH